MLPDTASYLRQEANELCKVWPENRTTNMVCHGHSIPCGYTSNHVVRMKDAYPHLIQNTLWNRYPMAVINVIVSGIGGEASLKGAKRFEADVLNHKPDIITIDYGRNDMFHPVKEVEKAWRLMIEKALNNKAKIILVTPAPDCGQLYYDIEKKQSTDEELAEMIRGLAGEYEVGIADASKAFYQKLAVGDSLLSDYLISVNHLNRAGHEIIAKQVLQWFPY